MARADGASASGRAIAIAETFDGRGALAGLTDLARAAVGIAAAIAGHARDPAHTIGTTESAVVANVLAAETGIATHIAGASRNDAIIDSAATVFATRNAHIAGGSGAATAFALGATPIIHLPRAKVIDRAAKIFAITMTGTATVVAAFGIGGIGRVEMRMAAMIAANLATFGHGGIGRDIAAPVCHGANTATDGILTANLTVRIETTAIGFDQWRNADRVLNGNGLLWGRRRSAEFARFLQIGGRLGRDRVGDRRSQGPSGGAAGGGDCRPDTQQATHKRTPTLAGCNSPSQAIEGVLIHRGRPNPAGQETRTGTAMPGETPSPRFCPNFSSRT